MTSIPPFASSSRGWCLAALAAFTLAVSTFAADAPKKSFNLPADDAAKTLKAFSEQSGEQIVYPVEQVRGVMTNAVSGELTARAALDQMLKDTGLVAVQDEKTGALAVKRDVGPNAQRVAQKGSDRPGQSDKTEGEIVKLDRFEVMGSKLLNMDKQRSRDDAQPYVIFNRDTLEHSGATNLEDFLKQRLTMETTMFSDSQSSGAVTGNRSSINLRGLGMNQTLILVDGHRLAGASWAGTPLQPDLNGIPLGMVERIEILPTTASGIYGGSATGGVVNIILRRDYVGFEVKATYDNTFDTDTARRRIDFTAGLTLEHGKTSVLFAASYADSNRLLVQDRNFYQRGIKLTLANNPDYIYGSGPPLGRTTNLNSGTGANLVLKPAYGGTNLGSSITYIPIGYAGAASDHGAGLVANAGKFNLDLADTTEADAGRSALLNDPVTESFSATVRRQFTPWLQGFVDFGYSKNTGHFRNSQIYASGTLDVTAPNNPFTTAVDFAAPVQGKDSQTLSVSTENRLVLGAIVALPRDWQLELDYTRHRNGLNYDQTGLNYDFALDDALANGTLDVMKDLVRYPADPSPYLPSYPVGSFDPIRTTLDDWSVRTSGTVWEGWAGPVAVSTLLEDRKEATPVSHRQTPLDLTTPNLVTYGARSATVRSVYAETKIPLVAEKNQVPLVRELELQISGRRDEYTTKTGSLIQSAFPAVTQIVYSQNRMHSANPTIGLRYTPVSDVMLRASYGTGFLPPAVHQITAPSFNPSASLSFLRDPQRGSARVTQKVVLYAGGNPDLKPEHSKSWSAGVVYTPRGLKGLRVSVDWVKIEKTDNITFLSSQRFLDNEFLLPGRITRGPVAPGDPYGVGLITAINSSLVNIARVKVEAVDFAVDYALPTSGLGAFTFFANGTRALHYQTQLVAGQPIIEQVGQGTDASSESVYAGTRISPPLKLRLNGGLIWTKGPWTATWTTRWYSHYQISPQFSSAAAATTQGNGGWVNSQTFHDATVAYDFGRRAPTEGGQGLGAGFARALGRTQILVGVRNVFNTSPQTVFYAPYYSSLADPRGSSYYISVKHAF
jgi:outer membrane receptor protein involved in Fe transport